MKGITNKFVCLATIAFATVAFAYFCYTYDHTMKELPYLTWMDQMRNVGVPYLDGNLKLSHLLSRYGEHGLLGYNILYIINIKFFGLTTKFDVVVNAIFVAFSFICIVLAMVTSMENNAVKLFAPICTMAIFMFNIMQGSSGAMETQVRMGMNLVPLYAIIVSGYYFQEKPGIGWNFFLILITVLIINVFGTLYTFAVAPFLVGPILFCFIAKKQNKLKYFIPLLVVFLCCILYMREYSLFFFDKTGGGTSTGGIFAGILAFFKNFKETILSWFSYNASSVYGYRFDLENEAVKFLSVGAAITFLLVLSVVLFFVCKVYERSWVPFFLIGYSLFVFVLTRIGRVNGWQYYCAEWYICHTKFQMCAMIWIYCDVLSGKKLAILKQTALVTGCLSLAYCIHTGTQVMLHFLPHIGYYYEDKQKYLLYPETDFSKEGDTPLLGSYDNTVLANAYMRKYQLSYFKSNPYTTDYNAGYQEGTYDLEADGLSRWISPNSMAIMRTGNGILHVRFYTPELGQNYTIYCNGIAVAQGTVEGNLVEFDVDTHQPNDTVVVRIVFDRPITSTGGDTRQLAAILNSLYFNKTEEAE